MIKILTDQVVAVAVKWIGMLDARTKTRETALPRDVS